MVMPIPRRGHDQRLDRRDLEADRSQLGRRAGGGGIAADDVAAGLGDLADVLEELGLSRAGPADQGEDLGAACQKRLGGLGLIRREWLSRRSQAERHEAVATALN